jgi:ribose transport system permease protein
VANDAEHTAKLRTAEIMHTKLSEPQTPPGDGRAPALSHRRLGLSGALVGRWAVPLLLLVLILVFSVSLPSQFLTAGNFRAMILSQAVLLLLAVGVTLPLRAGDFDLSIGSSMVFCALVLGLVMNNYGWPVWAAIMVSVLIGCLVGMVNAVLVVVLGMSGFVATLGTMTVLQGLSLAISNSQVVAVTSHSLRQLGQTNVIGLPDAAFYGWGIALILWYVYRYLPFGRHLLFVGGNQQASRLAGIAVSRVRILSFVFAGLIGGIAGFVLISSTGAVDPTSGAQYLIAPYAAAYLGIATIQLGRFNIVGTLFALYLVVVGETGLQLLGAAEWVSDVFNGLALLIAIGLSRFFAGRRGAGRRGKG